MGIKTTTLLVLAALSAANAFYEFVPPGQEMVYDYSSRIYAGVHYPEEYASEFYLHGKLHVQVHKKVIYIKLTDLVYKMYNGKVDHDYVAKEIPVGPEVSDLMKVFKIEYEPSGVASSYSVSSDEGLFSKNIKRSIATMFQFNFDKHDSKLNRYSFTDEEPTIYGKKTVHYTAFKHDEDTGIIHKFFEFNAAKSDLYHLHNVNFHQCKSDFKYPVSQNLQYEYHFGKVDGVNVVKVITASDGIHYVPHEAEADFQYIHSNVTFEFVQMYPIKTQFEVVKEEKHTQWEFEMFDHSEWKHDGVVDVYQGRRHIDQKKLKTEVFHLFETAYEYIRLNHVHLKAPNMKNGQLINRIQRAMLYLELPTLKEMWTEFSTETDEKHKKMWELFEKMLPTVGSHDSMLFIMDLVSHNKIKEDEAVSMLQDFPMNAKMFSEKFLTELVPLLHLDEAKFSWEVRKAGILAFSTYLYRVGHFTVHSEEYLAKKYIEEFYKKMIESDDFEVKMTYMSAMYNTRSRDIIPYLKKIITGEVTVSEHLKLMALWAVSPVINDDEAYHFYWPILTDISEKTYYRIVALYLFIDHDFVMPSKMMSLVWYMHKEPNHEVYQFYYKYLYALANSVDECKFYKQSFARQIMKYTHKPNFYGWTGFWNMDYLDETFGFGRGFDIFSVVDKTSVLFKWSWNYNYFNHHTYPWTYMIKIHGIDGLDKIGLNTDPKKNTLFNYEELSNYFAQLKKSNKKLHVEYYTFHHDMVYDIHYIDMTSAPEFIYFLAAMTENFHEKSHDLEVQTKFQSYQFYPTIAGFLATMEYFIPKVDYGYYDIAKETLKDITTYKFDVQDKVWSYSRFGLSFYNSIADVWQGVNKMNSFDSYYPVYFDLTYYHNPASLKVTFHKHKDAEKDTYGYRTYTTTMTFVKDDLYNEALTKSTPEAIYWATVTKGDEYRHDDTQFAYTNPDTGYHHESAIIDSEYSHKTLLGYVHGWMQEEHFGADLTTLFSYFMQKWDRTYLMPWPATYGVVERWTPSTTHPVSSYEMTFRSTYDIQRGDYPLLPGFKWNSKFSFSNYQDTKALKSWDVHALFDLHPGHTNYNMKMQFHRIVDGKPEEHKYCLEGSKKWFPDYVAGIFYIGETDGPVEKKCTEKDAIFEVTMKGVKSEEQLSKYPVYEACEHTTVSDFGVHHKTYDCYKAWDTYRNYTYTYIEGEKMTTTYKHGLTKMWEAIKGLYFKHYEHLPIPTESMPKKEVQVNVVYPTEGDTLAFTVKNHERQWHFDDVEGFEWKGDLDTAHFSTMYEFFHRMGWTHYCALYNDTIHFKYEHVPYHLPAEWTMILGDVATNPTYAVYAKEVEGTHHMALKLVHKEHSLVFVPTTEYHYDITLDGTKMTKDTYTGDWFFYQQQAHTDFVSIIGYHLGVHMFYDGTHVHIDVPKMDHPFYGKCVAH